MSTNRKRTIAYLHQTSAYLSSVLSRSKSFTDSEVERFVSRALDDLDANDAAPNTDSGSWTVTYID